MSSPTTPFPFSTRVGYIFLVEIAMLSALSVLGTILYIAYSAVNIKRGASRTWSTTEHIHYYFLNLLLSDFVLACGHIMDIKWLIDATITAGHYCTAQAIIRQIGDVGVAMTTLAIALHTFSVLVFGTKSSPKTALGVLGVIWLFITLMVGISWAVYHSDDYYGPTTYWCWITRGPNWSHKWEQVMFEYFWMFLAAAVNIICYIYLAFFLKPLITFKNGRLRFEGMQSDSRKAAMQMLFYPAVYLATVFPITMVRWQWLAKNNVAGFGVTAFASALLSLSGLFNVILYWQTRPAVLPNRDMPVRGTGGRPQGTNRPADEVLDLDELEGWIPPSGKDSADGH